MLKSFFFSFVSCFQLTVMSRMFIFVLLLPVCLCENWKLTYILWAKQWKTHHILQVVAKIEEVSEVMYMCLFILFTECTEQTCNRFQEKNSWDWHWRSRQLLRNTVWNTILSWLGEWNYWSNLLEEQLGVRDMFLRLRMRWIRMPHSSWMLTKHSEESWETNTVQQFSEYLAAQKYGWQKQNEHLTALIHNFREILPITFCVASLV